VQELAKMFFDKFEQALSGTAYESVIEELMKGEQQDQI